MTLPRRLLVDPSRPGWYHCFSRCVRRAYLCGDGYEHRKPWIEKRLRYLAGYFAVDVAAFAVMSNHLHIVLRLDPVRAQEWSPREVAQRWLAVYPQQYFADGSPVPPKPEWVERRARDPLWVARRRERLGQLGWFMKALKEPIARRANKEDGCTGAFWEGRFKSVALLDQRALIACQAYVDLNPIRAGVADRPERCKHTSVKLRLAATASERTPHTHDQRTNNRQKTQRSPARRSSPTRQPLWLMEQEQCCTDPHATELILAQQVLNSEQYIELVATTARLIHAGHRNRVIQTPPHWPALLRRLDVTRDSWIGTMASAGQMFGSAVGSARARTGEARRRGVHWLANKCQLFQRPPSSNGS